MKLCIYFALVLCCFLICEAAEDDNNEILPITGTGTEILEQGRTLVHNTVKRLMVILPAIFFKLGIAFTLLVLVTIVAVNNGFIGFLLLVVGMSSVLARLQDSGKRPVAYVASPLPYHHHHQTVWDRSDSTTSPSAIPNENFLQAASTLTYPQIQYQLPSNLNNFYSNLPVKL